MNHFTIPKAIQLVLDDVGWMHGEDKRVDFNMPARTNIPRKHVLEDYVILEELGKAINMKIVGMFVIGEWDTKGILANVPNSNWMGNNWKGSPDFDSKEAQKILEYVNASAYFEFGVHGLLHDLWDEAGNFVCGGELFFPDGMKRGNKRRLAPDPYLRAHFDAFFEIYHDWGFRSPLRCYASPCGAEEALPEGRLTKILSEYGIPFWHNTGPAQAWYHYGRNGSAVQNGVIATNKAIELAPWAAYDLDPDALPTYDPQTSGIIGGHWPNVLRFNPQKNLENLDRWIAFFHRQAEVFGQILSRDIAFAHYQQLYCNYSRVAETENSISICLDEADALLPNGIRPNLYISLKKHIKITGITGGEVIPYEERDTFINYEIKRNDKSTITIQTTQKDYVN